MKNRRDTPTDRVAPAVKACIQPAPIRRHTLTAQDNPVNMPAGLVQDRILRIPEVMQIIGIRGKATLYRWVKNGEFPAPLSLGGTSVGFRERDIQEWIASRQEVTLPSMTQQ